MSIIYLDIHPKLSQAYVMATHKAQKNHGHKGLATRDRILEAAALCISTNGVERTSVTLIAKKAKLTRGLITFYFPKKESIFLQVMQKIVESYYHYLQRQTVSLATAATEQILMSARVNFEFFAAHPAYYKCFMLLYYYASVDPQYRAYNTQLMGVAPRRFASALKNLLPQLSEEAIKLHSESLHSELIAWIQKYHYLDHGLSTEQFLARMLEALRLRIEALVTATNNH